MKDMIMSYDPNMGYRRDKFTPFEQMTRTNGTCTPPCANTIYDVKFERLSLGGEGRSFQVAFPDFSFKSGSEYVACGYACIIGELGGNMGFFLGGSLMFVIDLVIEYVGILGKIAMKRFYPSDLTNNN